MKTISLLYDCMTKLERPASHSEHRATATHSLTERTTREGSCAGISGQPLWNETFGRERRGSEAHDIDGEHDVGRVRQRGIRHREGTPLPEELRGRLLQVGTRRHLHARRLAHVHRLVALSARSSLESLDSAAQIPARSMRLTERTEGCLSCSRGSAVIFSSTSPTVSDAPIEKG